MDYNTQNNTQSNTQNKNSNNQSEPLFPWEQNEKEKEELKQSFLSKYWMLLVLIILLAALPFTILKINFGKTQQSSNSTVNSNFKVSSNSQQISGPYLSNQEFDSLFNTTNFDVQYSKVGFLIIFNSSFSTETKIANNTYGWPLNLTAGYPYNNITEELIYIWEENITTSSNKLEETISLVGSTYETPKPIYMYSSQLSQSFTYVNLLINNKTYNGMEYSIGSATGPQTYYLGKNSISYNTTVFRFLGVKNNNIYNLTFIINNYSNIRSSTLNITKLVSIVSNFN